MKKESEDSFEILFGKQLDSLRIKKGYNTVEAFGKAFNNGKVHKDFSAYIHGKNIRFKTLVKFSYILKYDIRNLLDFEDTLPLIIISDNLSEANLLVSYAKRYSGNMKMLRNEEGKTQLEIDVERNIDRGNIAHYENGDKLPNLLTIEKFSKSYRIKPFELFKEVKVD